MHDLGLANETPYGRDGRHEHEHIHRQRNQRAPYRSFSHRQFDVGNCRNAKRIAFLRDEMLHTVAESAEAARQRIMRSPSSN